jgi:transposase
MSNSNALEELEAGEEAVAKAEAEADTAEPLGPIRERAKPRRKPLPDHLPRQEVMHLPADDGACKCRHIQPKCACTARDATTQAPAPAMPIPRGRATPATLAHLLVSMHSDHLPLYRQSEIYTREGLELDRSTLGDWVAWLLDPVVAKIRQHVFAAEKIHGDDTTVPLLAPGLGHVGEALQFSLPEPQSRAVRAAALVRNLRLRYLVDQCRCRFEIGGREALGKPVVHRHQKLTCLFAPSLVAPQSGEAGGATQFPRQGALAARPVEPLLVMILGRRGRSGRVLQQKKLALDAQHLGGCPAFFTAFGADDRFVDRGEPVGDLPGPAPSLCHKERKEPRNGPGPTWFVEGGAQQP